MNSINEVCVKMAAKYPNDIEKAVKQAAQRVRKLDDFEKFQNELIYKALRSIINDVRHHSNRQLRSQPIQHNKVVVAASSIVQKVKRGWLDYFIDGKTLGSLHGNELQKIADKEIATGKGHIFNGNLLLAIKPHVPADKTVAQCLSSRKIKAIADRVRSKRPKQLAAC